MLKITLTKSEKYLPTLLDRFKKHEIGSSEYKNIKKM